MIVFSFCATPWWIWKISWFSSGFVGQSLLRLESCLDPSLVASSFRMVVVVVVAVGDKENSGNDLWDRTRTVGSIVYHHSSRSNAT